MNSAFAPCSLIAVCAHCQNDRFDQFSKAQNLSRSQAQALWEMLDADNSGEVSRSEFNAGLAKLQAARAWLRYCPDCVYMNTCNYCQECNANCSDCTENAFCASCWADHPKRHAVALAGDGEDGVAAPQRALDQVSQLRTNSADQAVELGVHQPDDEVATRLRKRPPCARRCASSSSKLTWHCKPRPRRRRLRSRR